MKNDYFHRVAALTPTKMWINNVTPEEAEWAIAAGAMGCTQNPSYTWKMLNHETGRENTLALLDETLKESDDDNEVKYILQRKLVKGIADKLGPRKALTLVVSVWSMFTALTGAARSAIQMLVLRFLFGVGEAWAFPGATQAFFRRLPVKDRGLAHGINFSGSRLGAAFSLFLMPWLPSYLKNQWPVDPKAVYFSATPLFYCK